MIKPEERDSIIKIIGSKHVKKIQDHLSKNNITAPNNKPYSKTIISYILSGKRENEVIENAIIAFAHSKMLEKEKNQEIKDLLTKKHLRKT
ncbi:hypothetical protein ACFSTE_12300 [Aquimarina hainanensis]|uniref:Recombinase domain-containing protein n=1 Tax=Aquimarina hainanensis TaxID=1578017 RepID=A0ABW5N835_9FLAO|nr:hypothetical protein [Aquimarina sp. TRL1]QKX03796.1 hypothetical protein HN014_02295 [Aquimarina sp. TRL1]